MSNPADIAAYIPADTAADVAAEIGTGSEFSSWMYKVALNVVLSERRSRRRRPGPVTSSREMAPLEDRAPQRRPDVTVDLQRAMAKLPERARVVFVLHDIQGYRHREIARLTGVAQGTSKAQLHRARRLLRKALRS